MSDYISDLQANVAYFERIIRDRDYDTVRCLACVYPDRIRIEATGYAPDYCKEIDGSTFIMCQTVAPTVDEAINAFRELVEIRFAPMLDRRKRILNEAIAAVAMHAEAIGEPQYVKFADMLREHMRTNLLKGPKKHD